MSRPNLTTDICGIKLKNPVIAASGTFGFGREYDKFYDIGKLGGISVKGLTRAPRLGNPGPRVCETASGMLNAVGLQNPGVDAFLKDELPWLRSKGTCIIANAAGACEDDYAYMCQRLANEQVDIIEMNISCPNVKEGGVAFGTRPENIYRVVKCARAEARQPLMVKLSPNVADIGEAARAAEEAGADAISLINTLTGMAVNVRTRRPILANVTGGLSGPAIKPVALRMVWQAARAVKLPIVGMGGIMTAMDAIEFLLCGACAVMVGTAIVSDPMAPVNIIDGLEQYMAEGDIATISELIGSLRI